MLIVCGGRIDRLEPSLVWQEEGKYGAAWGGGGAGANAQAAALLANQLAGDPQTQASAGVFFRCEEGLEDTFEMLGGDAEAGVGDGDAHACTGWLAWIGGGSCLDTDDGTAVAGIETVREQIGEDLAKFARGAEHLLLGGGIDGEDYTLVCGAHCVEIGDLADDRCRLEVSWC